MLFVAFPAELKRPAAWNNPQQLQRRGSARQLVGPPSFNDKLPQQSQVPEVGRSPSPQGSSSQATTPIVKILIVDDHSLVREGLQAILSRSDLNAQFVEAWDGATVQAQLEQHPDIALMLLDIQLPGSSGLQLLPRIVEKRPQLPVIMLSSDCDPQTVTLALNSGASGFLPKTSLNQVLVSAIRLVIAGGIYIPPEALQKPVRKPAAGSASVTPAVTYESLGFTARQIDVFRLLLQGMSNKQICRQMDLAEGTVKIHVRGILRSLTVNSRAEAIAKAAQLGLQAPSADAPSFTLIALPQ